MTNRTELIDVSAYHKIMLDDNGVHYAMKVVALGDGFYRCEGYALAGGVTVAEQYYWADDFGQAISDDTKQYLYRELKQSVLIALRRLYRVAVDNGAGE